MEEELKAQIAELRQALKKAEAQLYRVEQSRIKAENDEMLSMIKDLKHSLICPLCGVTLADPPVLGMHGGCYRTGYWSKGFRTHNDWLRASIANGAMVQTFYSKSEKNLDSVQENGKGPYKA